MSEWLFVVGSLRWYPFNCRIRVLMLPASASAAVAGLPLVGWQRTKRTERTEQTDDNDNDNDHGLNFKWSVNFCSWLSFDIWLAMKQSWRTCQIKLHRITGRMLDFLPKNYITTSATAATGRSPRKSHIESQITANISIIMWICIQCWSLACMSCWIYLIYPLYYIL